MIPLIPNRHHSIYAMGNNELTRDMTCNPVMIGLWSLNTKSKHEIVKWKMDKNIHSLVCHAWNLFH